MKKILAIALCVVMLGSFATMFAGCGKTDAGEVNVYNWGEYIAEGQDGLMNVIEEFEKETGIKVNYTTYETNEDLYNMLKNSNVSYDVIVPSEYMISKMIKEGMLLELNYDNIPNYKYIPKNWDALWDEDLKGDILMFNNSRDAMAIAMQTLGIDPSNCTKEDIDKASEKLREQKPLLKKYVMDQVFTEMETSQSAIAPYYAGDIAAMMDENEDLDYCLPDYGSNLFYDAMCIPTCSKNKENAEKFINFMQKPEIAAENCKYLRYGCANDEAVKLLDDEIKNNELTLPSDEYLDKCYVFGNLDPEVYEYMQEQFVKIQAE